MSGDGIIERQEWEKMKERPIIFSAPMVRAILEGRKTQTRRIVKGAAYFAAEWPFKFGRPCSDSYCCYTHMDGKHLTIMRPPYGEIGDRLWVRENGWQITKFIQGIHNYCYDADGYNKEDVELFFKPLGFKRRPSIHMPRWASRINLEITGVRVDRLQNISAIDAIYEGVHSELHEWRDCECPLENIAYRATAHAPMKYSSPIDAYRDLWESINGIGSWEVNPWVWAIEFRRVQ